MKKPLHLVIHSEYRATLYRQYRHNGETYWKGIGGIAAGNLDGLREYVASTEKYSGSLVATHSIIPQDVITV